MRIIDYGSARNARSSAAVAGTTGPPDPTERRYITVTNDVGAVHTFIVDVEHAASDAKSLVEWIDHTRTLVEHYPHLSPADVATKADELLSNSAQPSRDIDAPVAEHPQTQTGGFE